ncbi:hypothetical protein SUGI_1397100 [Cryptomeria japonica]|uniref:Histone deacetylase interacting domain-containing protein n=1 Tax=Cryptomeria japonica TaxID=3369 RepID=A0AAD3RQQ7_CRYJA|nr:hypothetical protein SUGI_1397100 [Cryptomeria japonica]
MKRAAEKERSEIRGPKRCRFAEGYEEMPLPTEIDAQSYLISVKEHFKDDMGKFAEFIQILDDFRSKTCDAIKVIARLKQLVKSHELLLGFNKFLPKGFEILLPSEDFLRDGHKDQHHKSRAMLGSNALPASNNEKITYKPKSEMDLSHLEQCTPRYRLIPQNFLKPVASCSTDLDAEVLNDICVSVASGTEDYRRKRQFNTYEQAILNCEDDRFELDMLIKNLEAAIERVHELLEKQHAHFRIEDHLTAMNLRCIELIYSNCGLRIIDLLLEKPDRCLPVIVKRLQQKHEEWVNYRTRFNKGWAESTIRDLLTTIVPALTKEMQNV